VSAITTCVTPSSLFFIVLAKEEKTMNRYTKQANEEATRQLEKIHAMMAERNYGSPLNFLTTQSFGNKN
jgi:hypothetical protein